MKTILIQITALLSVVQAMLPEGFPFHQFNRTITYMVDTPFLLKMLLLL